jgi:hypothetical protein
VLVGSAIGPVDSQTEGSIRKLRLTCKSTDPKAAAALFEMLGTRIRAYALTYGTGTSPRGGSGSGSAHKPSCDGGGAAGPGRGRVTQLSSVAAI